MGRAARIWNRFALSDFIITIINHESHELNISLRKEMVAFVNAVSHRDYFERGAHTVVEIFDDRLEVSSPGGLPKGLNLADFGRKAVRRNQLIASLLHRAGYGEYLGTGITKIRDLLDENECPDIDFEISTFFTSVFKRPLHEEFDLRANGLRAPVKKPEAPVQALVEVHDPCFVMKRLPALSHYIQLEA